LLIDKRPFPRRKERDVKSAALIGYARVSTNDQTINLQRDALKAAGCKRIFADQGVSGSVTQRRGLDRALKSLKPGDTLVVWKLDRLGRSLAHLVQTIAELGARGVNFRSLSDPIDTESAGGRLVLHIMAALAEFERSLNSERTKAGLAAAKRRGKRLGRRPKLTTKQVESARRMVEDGRSPQKVAKRFSVARSTLYEALKR
jgi:DNA invertase Pin-like site-specific DNA recombinase